MKLKEKNKLLQRNEDELQLLLRDEKSKFMNLRLQQAQNKLKNTRMIGVKRKDIARILTLIRQKQLLQSVKQTKKETK